MKKYQCLIVDDEELARELLESYLEQLPDFELVASCASAIEANQKLKESEIDLMFLDIEMPVLKGLEFYESLDKKPKVIFTTAYREYALEGFEQEAVDYLLKPIVFSRFFKATEKFLSLRQPIPDKSIRKFIFVRENRKQQKVYFDEILYICSLKDYIQIYLPDKKHIVKFSISAFLEQLDDNFVRVHRSYIVNKNKVSAFSNTDIEINDIEIPIGDHYRSSLKALF